MTTRPNFDPQAGYLVTAAADFINFNDQVFTDYYQPVLGPVAFSLFYALRSQLLDHPTLADRRLQSALLVQVNAGQSQVSEGLRRLEGMGIVQTLRGTCTSMSFRRPFPRSALLMTTC